jgi:hypothetical protein
MAIMSVFFHAMAKIYANTFVAPFITITLVNYFETLLIEIMTTMHCSVVFVYILGVAILIY